jgi:hypothetical protein
MEESSTILSGWRKVSALSLRFEHFQCQYKEALVLFAVHMPRPYDNDLRRMILAAYASGKGTQAELALLFGVGVSWVEKVCRQQRQTGQMERIEQGMDR